MLSKIVSSMSSKSSILAVEIALIIFFAIFMGILIYTLFFYKKEKVEYLSKLPLEPDNKNSNYSEEIKG